MYAHQRIFNVSKKHSLAYFNGKYDQNNIIFIIPPRDVHEGMIKIYSSAATRMMRTRGFLVTE